MIPDTLEQPGYLIVTIIVLSIVIFLVVDVFFNVKIGRGVCNMIGFVLKNALGVLGFTTDIFSPICDRLPF
ncbi:MAG TPA: hypothetical protein VJH90_02665 [archaeon]|nr:hypothetical protein [archaeon]